MAEKKITKRENFEGIMNFLAENGKSEWAEVMAHEIELLARKASKSATATPAQKDNAEIAEIVKDILAGCADVNGMTVGALLKEGRIAEFKCHNGDSISSQKMTSIISALAKSGDVTREVIKKVAYFRLNYGEIATAEVEG